MDLRCCALHVRNREGGGGYGFGFQLRSTLFHSFFFWVLDLAQDLCAVNLKQATMAKPDDQFQFVAVWGCTALAVTVTVTVTLTVTLSLAAYLHLYRANLYASAYLI